jgi:hypothetical protein
VAEAPPTTVEGCVYGDSKLGELVVVVDGWPLCVRHWRAEGRPWPVRKAEMQAAQRALEKARDAMNKRGGADRHMVRNGRT